VFSAVKAPPTIDAMLPELQQETGIRFVSAPLLSSNPYEVLTRGLISGLVVGSTTVNGIPCEHLAFRSPGVNWEIWIESGRRALPWRLAATSTDRTNFPRTLVEFVSWNLSPWLKSSDFVFRKPAGAREIPFLSVIGPGRANPIDVKLMKHIFLFIAIGILFTAISVSQTGCTGGYVSPPDRGLPTVPTFLTGALTMAGPDSIAGPTMATPGTIAILMVVPRTGTMALDMLMARAGVPQAGTAGQGARQAGAEAPHRGTMDRATSADIAGAPLLGEGAQAAQRAGEAAQPVGAVDRAPSMGPMADRVAGGADSPKPNNET
jgi:hypothetical protein